MKTFNLTSLPVGMYVIVMVYENNFEAVIVDRPALIDPVLKLRLTDGRLYQKPRPGISSVDVKLFHDPEIQPGKLTMPPSENSIRIAKMFGAKPSEEEVFQSSKSVCLANFLIYIDRVGDDVALIFYGANGATLRAEAELIERAEREPVSSRPWETLRYALESIANMPIWDNEFYTDYQSTHIGMYIPRSIAIELGSPTDIPFPAANDSDLVRISYREREIWKRNLR